MTTPPITRTSSPISWSQLRSGWMARGRCMALVAFFFSMLLAPIALTMQPAYAAANAQVIKPIGANTSYQCGSGANAVHTSINIGCYGANCQSKNIHGCSALLDATFAIIRFLSAGVGIVVIASVIWAGIQYTSARDDPSAVGKAKSRIVTSLSALGLFIFGYAILNYVIPAGFFK